jgi:predicted 3-demethylubiquinone-9 3-methyltransferase (glyoxalase superfamily)
MAKVQKISPFLWFDDNAEEAVNFYCATFANSRVVKVARNGGKVFGMSFELDGVLFQALNGGPMFKFTEAISLFVSCDDQKEVDRLWARLTSDGGTESRCGWLKDKYGLSWQIVPKVFADMMADKDPAKSGRVMAAMMKMGKFDIAKLEAAYGGR